MYSCPVLFSRSVHNTAVIDEEILLINRSIDLVTVTILKSRRGGVPVTGCYEQL